MSADIIILPFPGRESRGEQATPRILLSIALTKLSYARLALRASQWNMSVEDAAAAILSAELNPKSRR